MLPVGYGQNVSRFKVPSRGPAVSNQDVAFSWAEGEPAHSGHMTTDGRDIFSYALRIGFTDPNGRKVALLYRGGKPSYFHSMTTSIHVGRVAGVADEAVEPTLDNLARETIASVPSVG